MTDLTPNHPAVEAAARAAAIHGDYDGCFERVDQWNALEDWEKEAQPDEYPTTDIEDCEWWTSRARAALNAALPHLTADDIRHTPAGKQLMAEGKSAGWDDAIKELRKGQGMQRALAGTLNTRKPNYKEARDDRA